MYHDRYDDWNAWHAFGWLFPLLMIALIAATVIVATRLATSRAPSAAIGPPPAPQPADRVLEQVRMRYAAGEIDRAEYSRLMRDLGGYVPPDESSG